MSMVLRPTWCSMFQSTPRHGGDGMCRGVKASSQCFNPRLREEATYAHSTDAAVDLVSIHASVKRRRGCVVPLLRQALVSIHASVRRRLRTTVPVST